MYVSFLSLLDILHSLWVCEFAIDYNVCVEKYDVKHF
jgi:hypothetical protein